MTAFLADLPAHVRGAFRVFRTRPRFALLTAMAYALGIGVVTGVFSLVDDALLDPLPWASADRLVGIWERYPEANAERVPAAPAKIAAWRAEPGVFDRVAAWRLDDMTLTGQGDPERLPVGRVEPDLLPLLGIQPVLGRTFGPEEAVPGRDRVVLLSNAFWTERMGADPTVLGRTLTLEGEPYEVVGVLPRAATFPEGAEVVVPLVIPFYESRASHAYRVLGRLAPGVTVAEARTRLGALAARLASAYPETDTGWEASVVPLREQLVGDVTPVLLLLFGAGALVFLVACSNGASLLLVRTAGRQHELGVRASLGASAGRLVAQLAAESLALAVVGGAAGLLLARAAVAGLRAASPVSLPEVTAGKGFDVTVYLFALGAAVAAGLLFGLLPALRATRRDPMAALREGGRTGSRRRSRTRSLVVGGEVALATLLLVGSGLFVRSARALADVDPGFEPARVLTVDLRPPRNRYATDDDFRTLYTQLLAGVQGLPGVQDAALVNYIPLGGRADTFRFLVEGRPAPESMDALQTQMRSVSAGYFRTMGIEVRRGRAFGPGDRESTEPVAVVNQAMARRYWPEEDVVGAHVSLNGDEGPWLQVVGVVEDVRSDGLTEPAPPGLYVPMRQQPWPLSAVVLKTSGDPLALVAAVRQVVARIDPLLPLGSVRTGEDLVRHAGARWRFQALLLGVFAAVALALAVTGVYGLLAYVVQERAGEMAVRQAVGARPADLRRLVGGDTLRLAGAGGAVGLAATALLSRVLRELLFGVSPLDPWSYAAGGALMVTVALLAAWAPARRAGRVDPAAVLRSG